MLLNNTTGCIKEKLYTHSLNGFTYYIKIIPLINIHLLLRL